MRMRRLHLSELLELSNAVFQEAERHGPTLVQTTKRMHDELRRQCGALLVHRHGAWTQRATPEQQRRMLRPLRAEIDKHARPVLELLVPSALLEPVEETHVGADDVADAAEADADAAEGTGKSGRRKKRSRSSAARQADRRRELVTRFLEVELAGLEG